MAKSTKKNNEPIAWPDVHFTIDDMFKKYPDFVQITLRFRVKRGLENKEIVAIGKVKPAIGRPRLVFAKANPSKELLESATKVGVLPLDDTSKNTSVPAGEVTAPKKATKVVTAAAPVATTVAEPVTAS